MKLNSLEERECRDLAYYSWLFWSIFITTILFVVVIIRDLLFLTDVLAFNVFGFWLIGSIVVPINTYCSRRFWTLRKRFIEAI